MRRQSSVNLLLLFFVPGLLCACGDGPDAEVSEGARVRLLTSPVDGPVQGTVHFEDMEDRAGKAYAAEPLPGDPAVFVAPGAPPGRYYVYSSEGWGMLWGGTGGSTGPPYLRGSDFPALTVRMGRPRSLYVGAENPSTVHGHVDVVWGAEWKVAQEGSREDFRPADVEIVSLGEGLVAIRFPPEIWKAGHALRASGRMVSGAVTPLIAFQITKEKRENRPRIAFTHAAPQAALSVYLVPPPGLEQVPDGTPVTVTLLDIPLTVTYDAASHKGEARFDDIGSLGHGLRIALPRSGADAAFVMDQETWRTRLEMYAVAIDPQTAAVQTIDVGSHEIVEVRVRFENGSRYALVPASMRRNADTGSQLLVRTAPGPQQALLRLADGRWLEVSFTADREKPTSVKAEGEPEKPARIRGTVDGGGRGFRVQLTRIEGTAENPRRTTGAGLSAAVDPYGAYEASVPAGSYEVQVIRPGGALTRPLRLPMKAGSEVHRDLAGR